MATMPAVGTPSASASSGFYVLASNVEGAKLGLILYGVTGPVALSWNGASYLCVKPPMQRTPVQFAGGSPNQCNGSFALDWDAYRASTPGALGAPFNAGDVVCAQAWYRDPPAAKTTNLSNGLRFVVQP